ncbi:S-formylglutathione hydrolase [Acetobacteraceae bacterium]|nr:S-formylglutathione hydrolase [Acetobacteraceae bacterium]
MKSKKDLLKIEENRSLYRKGNFMTDSLELIASSAAFDGEIRFYKHHSTALNAEAKFSVFLPRRALKDMAARKKGIDCKGRTPYIMALAGLTSHHKTFITKSGALPFVNQHNIALVCPDTSPRNCNLDKVEDCWWIGEGAGYYLNATKEPWSKHYKMYDYISEELPKLVASQLWLDNDRKSIMGHSMGGMGALNFGLKEPEKWLSVSAFAPATNPSKCQWGIDAAKLYFNDPAEGKAYDPTHLLQDGRRHNTPILIDQGKEDKFLHDGQLLPKNFLNVADKVSQSVIFRAHEKFDHSYWFIQSFIQSHIEFHSLYLHNDKH